MSEVFSRKRMRRVVMSLRQSSIDFHYSHFIIITRINSVLLFVGIFAVSHNDICLTVYYCDARMIIVFFRLLTL